MLGRCETYLCTPCPDEWDGVFERRPRLDSTPRLRSGHVIVIVLRGGKIYRKKETKCHSVGSVC
jgi:hypothetical protein